MTGWTLTSPGSAASGAVELKPAGPPPAHALEAGSALAARIGASAVDTAPAPLARATAAETVGSLRRAVAFLAETADPGLALVADRLAVALDGAAGRTFDAVFGLPATWRDEARRERRDALLRRLAQRHFADLRGRQLAEAVARAGRRYEASSWPRDSAAGRRPSGLSGELYDVLRLGKMPTAARLRQIFCDLPG